MYDTVLIPTDGSEEAEYAAGYGLALAAASGATVHVLSVVDESLYPRSAVLSDELIEQGLEEARREARRAVDRVVDLAPETVDCVTDVRQGVPADVVTDFAADSGADLVVMGTHGRTGLRRYIIGSVTEQVVRTADVPVLTVRKPEGATAGDRPDIDHVLVPTDGSDESMAAVDHALDIATAYDATLHALYVVDQRALSSYYEAGPLMGDLIDNLTSVGERAVAGVRERAEERGVAVETEVMQGLPAAAIREYSDDNEVDLVVMGTHGRTGVERYLLGSVTERVVRTSDVPVLTTRTAEADAEE
jgi:nucleotide-binding universal stress UspA family protein